MGRHLATDAERRAYFARLGELRIDHYAVVVPVAAAVGYGHPLDLSPAERADFLSWLAQERSTGKGRIRLLRMSGPTRAPSRPLYGGAR